MVCLVREVAFLIYYSIYIIIVFLLFRMARYFQKGHVGVLFVRGFLGRGYL